MAESFTISDSENYDGEWEWADKNEGGAGGKIDV